jgi:hypothetical protein
MSVLSSSVDGKPLRAKVDDWNVDPPAVLSSPGTRIRKTPEQLPEVVALCAAGWELAPDAPVWAFVPAVWPREDRLWVADRWTLTVEHSVNGVLVDVAPWTEQDYLEQDRDLDELCARSGVPSRPRDRLWLLRTPGTRHVDDILEEVVREISKQGIIFVPSTSVTRVTQQVIERVWSDQTET